MTVTSSDAYNTKNKQKKSTAETAPIFLRKSKYYIPFRMFEVWMTLERTIHRQQYSASQDLQMMLQFFGAV
jgi:hypothetical protein